METLKKLYEEEIAPNLTKKFNYTTKMQVPKIEKIVLNLKKVKTLKSNEPYFAPDDSYIIPPNAKAIFIHGSAKTVED